MRKDPRSQQHHHQVSSVIPVFTNNSAIQSVPVQQQQQQQQYRTHNNHNYNNNQHNNFEKKKVMFDLIPMTYVELYPSLVVKNLIQPNNPSHTPEPLPWWYKPDQNCAYHQGEPSHDIENCYPLKYGFQKLFKSGMMSFEDRTPNVKVNPLPAHGNSSMNMVMVVLVISKFLMFVVSKGIWCRYIELCT